MKRHNPFVHCVIVCLLVAVAAGAAPEGGAQVPTPWLAKPGLPAVAIGSFSRGSFGLTPYFFAGKIRLRGGTGGFATLTSAMSSTSPVQLGADIATPTKHGADDFRRLWIMDTNSLARCE